MSKIFNSRVLIMSLVVLGVVLLIFFVMRYYSHDKEVRAYLSSTEITLGQSVLFADSTSGASNWLWEFGNGDYSNERSGSYIFTDEGRYQIRLKVDNELEKSFLVRVKSQNTDNRLDHLIVINAPETAIQGEQIVFAAEGNDKDWKWEFGESGIVDSREKTAIYAYENQGVYQVRLTTENTQYPIYHLIEIEPKYMEIDELDEMTIAALDIKEKLQNIADGNPFNVNYNHILKTYLCDKPNILVTINNDKRNDFYSYCQGLRIAGHNNTIIDMVYVEASNPETSCIDHIILLQHDKTVGQLLNSPK